MKKLAISAVLGLSIIGGVLAAPNTANAFRLRNYKNFSLFIGVAAGTPTNGTPFIVWPEDHSANQSFAGSTSYVVPGAQIILMDNVAQNAIADVAGYSPYRQPVTVGYPIDYTNYPYGPVYNQKSFWIVDNQIILTYTDTSTGNKYTCYRFKNSVRQDQVIGVSGGSTSKGSAVVVYDRFDSTYPQHLDQFWCPVAD